MKKILPNPSDLCSRLQPVPFCGVEYDKKELSSLIAGEAGSNTSRLHTTLPLYLHEYGPCRKDWMKISAVLQSFSFRHCLSYLFLCPDVTLLVPCYLYSFHPTYMCLKQTAGFTYKNNFVMLKMKSSFRLPP